MPSIVGEYIQSGYIIVDPSGNVYTGDHPAWSPIPTNALIIPDMDTVHRVKKKGDRVFPAKSTLVIGPETKDFYDQPKEAYGQ